MKRGIVLGGAAAALVAGILAAPAAWAQKKTTVRVTDDVDTVQATDDGRKVERRVVVRRAGGGGFLGVSLEDTGGDARGAVVRSVEDGSPAAKAGLKDGDVIVRFDGESVRSAASLARLVGETPAGRSVAIEVTRAGQPQKLTATLDEGRRKMSFFSDEGGNAFDLEIPEPPEAPEPPALPRVAPAPPPPHAPLPPHAPVAPRAWSWNSDDRDMLFRFSPAAPRRLGIQFFEMGEQLAAHYKLARKTGVLVTAVDEGSPAAKAGIAAGDVVLEVDGKTIEDGSDLRDAVRAVEGGKEVSVKVQRDGRPIDLTATLPAAEAPRARAKTVKAF
jgi:predicted metalloprotease with PDZ domain